MVYGYARVSTKGQQRDGNSLDAQKQALIDHGAETIYVDGFTGTKLDRPEFGKLLSVVQSGDTIVVTKLDRFARTVSQASELITQLIDKGVTVNVLNLGELSNNSVSTLMRNILLSFAQFERDMIVERTQEGKAIARANAESRGEKYIEGRPKKYDDETLTIALDMLKTKSYTQVTKVTGISKSTLIRAKKLRHIVVELE